MRKVKLTVLAPIILSTSMVTAAPGNGKGQGPRDVNVINTPSVFVENPQTSVQVGNDTNNPVPVSGTVSLQSNAPLPVEVVNNSTSSYHFIGYSAGRVTSPQIGSQSKLCRDTFGESARWASTKEVREAFESGAFTDLPPVLATLKPNYTHALWDVNNNRSIFYDADASYQIIDPGCSSDNRSIVLSTSGVFEEGPCWATAFDIVAACSLPQ
jgi:hypothetical protein